MNREISLNIYNTGTHDLHNKHELLQLFTYCHPSQHIFESGKKYHRNQATVTFLFSFSSPFQGRGHQDTWKGDNQIKLIVKRGKTSDQCYQHVTELQLCIVIHYCLICSCCFSFILFFSFQKYYSVILSLSTNQSYF